MKHVWVGKLPYAISYPCFICVHPWLLSSKHKSLEFNFFAAKVNEEPYLHAGGFEFVEELSFVFLVVLLRHLEFDHDRLIHEQIGFVKANLDSLIMNTYLRIERRVHAPAFQLNHHCLLVHRFEDELLGIFRTVELLNWNG